MTPDPAPPSDDNTVVRAVRKLADSTHDSGSKPTDTDPDVTHARAADTRTYEGVGVQGYTVQGELGRGGMGVVYRATQTKLNRPAAIKMVLGDVDADSKQVIRFLAEAEAVAAVQHPHVVGVYDYGEAGGRPFLALEFCGGGSLADRLKAVGRFDPRSAADLIRKLADGVAAAHAAGIVHRDLKPGNVLFDDRGEPKVSDFGLAKRAGADLTRTNAVMGTPAYMSPEQAKGDTKFVGPPADVWALGVMLFETLTGKRPFDAPETWALLQKVLYADPPGVRSVVKDLPRDLEQIVRKCLSKAPHERYPTAAELAADLAAFRDGKPISARPPSAPERTVKWVRRNPLPTALIAALSLLVAAVGLGGYLTNQQLQLANEAKEGQLRAEQGQREEQTTRQVAAAEAAIRAALQRGQATAAIAAFDRADADGLPVTAAMRLDRAKALHFLSEADAAAEALRRVTRDDLPADRRGEADLLEGLLALGTDDARGQDLIRAARRGRLAPADDLYAQGLLADSTAAALGKFREAFRADPAHIESRVMAALALALLARHAEAETLLEQTRPLAPDHPHLPFLHLVVAALRGDRPRAEALLADFRDRTRDPLVLEAVPAVADLLLKSTEFRHQFFDAGVYGAGGVSVLAMAASFRLDADVARRVRQLLDSPLAPARVFYGAPPCFRRDLTFLLSEILQSANEHPSGTLLVGLFKQWMPDLKTEKPALYFTDPAGQAAARVRVAEFPEGTLRSYYAVRLFELALERLDKGGWNPGVRELLAEAGAAFEDAAEFPGWISRPSFAVESAIRCYTLAYTPRADGAGKLEWKRKGPELARRREAMDPPMRYEDQFDPCVRGAVIGEDFPLARHLLDLWERALPKNLSPTYHRYRAMVEFRGEAFGPAARAVERIPAKDLAKFPDAALLLDIQRVSRQKLRLPELLPPPRVARE